jgi:hypothetical protein
MLAVGVVKVEMLADSVVWLLVTSHWLIVASRNVLSLLGDGQTAHVLFDTYEPCGQASDKLHKQGFVTVIRQIW